MCSLFSRLFPSRTRTDRKTRPQYLIESLEQRLSPATLVPKPTTADVIVPKPTPLPEPDPPPPSPIPDDPSLPPPQIPIPPIGPALPL